jgi:hypothetical protein
MKREDLKSVPEYYQNYISQVPDLPLSGVLHASLEALSGKLEEKLLAIGDEVYAPGKWRIADILQHLIDGERIMSYRALRFSRKDTTPLPGFDQDTYVQAAEAHRRPVQDLLEELKLVRVSSIFLFESFTDDMLLLEGPANGKEISVAALGFIIAGHQAHHLWIIEERYLPLAKTIISPF